MSTRALAREEKFLPPAGAPSWDRITFGRSLMVADGDGVRPNLNPCSALRARIGRCSRRGVICWRQAVLSYGRGSAPESDVSARDGGWQRRPLRVFGATWCAGEFRAHYFGLVGAVVPDCRSFSLIGRVMMVNQADKAKIVLTEKGKEGHDASYARLVSEFRADNVHRHSRHLRLHNPHYDPRIEQLILDKRSKLDWLHNSRDFTVQFVGSHWWNLRGLYDSATVTASGGRPKPSPFDPRLERLGISRRFQLSNCALGYIPDIERATGWFTRYQIEYLRPRKFEEYRTMGTRVVFAMGSPSLKFHVHGTGKHITRFADVVDGAPIEVDDGLVVIPVPHPGAQGILNYLRARKKERLDVRAQDAEFRRLVNKGFLCIGLEPLA
jgi:hypothetical protein